MEIKAVPFKEYLKYSAEQLVNGLKREQVVLFDNGIKNLTAHEVIVSSYFWKLMLDLNKTYKVKFPINRELTISNFYSNGFFVDGSLRKIIEYIFKIVNENFTFVKNSRKIIDEFILPRIADIYNDIYNDVIQNVIEYANSLFITDVLDIQLHDNILNAIKAVNDNKTPEQVQEAYKVVHETIRLPQYSNNTIAKGVISGVYNKGQIDQIFGPVGYGSELNSMVFKEPIVSSFALGLVRSFDIAVVSRVAAKALHFSSSAIENSEYLGRTLQMVCMQIENIVDGDCGNKDYMEWKLEENPVIGKSELDLLSGKFYYDPETKTEKMITKNDKHLIGKVIKIRTVLNCKHPHPKTICIRCFGGLAANIPYTSNVGHLCAANVTRDLSQKLLSTKHQADSSNSIKIELEQSLEAFVNVKDENYLVFKRDFVKKGGKRFLILPQEAMKDILNITPEVNLTNITPNKLSCIKEGIIKEESRSGVPTITDVVFSIAKTKSSKNSKLYGYFTTSFIKFILDKNSKDNENRIKIDSSENVIIDFTEWDNQSPFLEYPKVEYNLKDLTGEISKMVKTQVALAKTPYAFLQEFFNLLNVKLDINLALIEVITLAFCVSKGENGRIDYHVTRDFDNVFLSKLSQIVYNGSLGAMFAFEQHANNLMLPQTFKGNNNVDHPLDALLMPNETVNACLKGTRN